MVAALASEVTTQAMLIEKLKHQLSGMRRHRFGSTPEAMGRLEFALDILTSGNWVVSASGFGRFSDNIQGYGGRLILAIPF